MRGPGPETQAAAEAGYIVDLTDKLDISGLTDAAKNASTIDGKVWSVPVLGSYTVGLYYQRKIFADNNLTPPTTMEEFHTLCKTLQDKGITPMIAPAQDGVIPAFLYMMLSSGILGPDGFDKIRTGEKKFTDPDVLEAAIALKDMYPCFQEGSLGTPYVEGKALFALGQGAMLEGGSADFAGFQETNPDIDVGVVPFPAAKGGKPSTVTGMEGAFAINSKSAHIPEAVKFLQFMLGKEAAQMVVDTITLTTTKGVLPSNNRVMAEMLKAAESRDVRVFYEFPQTGDVMAALQQNAGSLFIGDLTPEQFAQKLQDAVKPSPL
jgi:raffinose/stachyose/melibiose transport system substrate-binding protein